MLGIELDDRDVLDVPLLLTDPYGRFIRGPTGFPQLVTAPARDRPTSTATADGAAIDATASAVGTGHAFLDDIAHHASRSSDGRAAADRRHATRRRRTTTTRATYDDEMLEPHFITGDGRGNENIGLTAVHHVFHAEHNRLRRGDQGR